MTKRDGSKPYTDPITVRFDQETFERLSRIKLSVQQMTGAKMAMSALIAAAVKEYVAKYDSLDPLKKVKKSK